MSARTYRALLIANSTFPADAQNLPDLEGPRNDPALLRDALCDSTAGLFPSDNIRLVTERTMAEVLRETEDFLSSASLQDTLLVYYSGHGLLDQRGELFLCTRDSRADRLRSTAVKASDVRGMMDESAALTTVVLLDCCHSGRFKGGVTPATLAGRGRFVITSSRGGELANDADVRNRASLFTHHLTEGLLRGAEDHDGDGVVNLSELYDYVHAALTTAGRQVPQKRFEGDGDVPVALRIAAREEPQPGLVAPAVAEPVLDLSDTVVDLGEVDADEILPPERIAVINRGGGSLAWTVESSAEWVDAVADQTGVVLHLRPQPGPNRANVFVRDTATGEMKTVRVSVRVRPAQATTTVGRAAAVAAPTTEAPTTEAPTTEAPTTEAAAVEPPRVVDPEPMTAEAVVAATVLADPEPVVVADPEPVVVAEPVAVVAAEPAAADAQPVEVAEAVAAEHAVAAEAAVVASAPPAKPVPSRRPSPVLLAAVAGVFALVAGILLMTTGFEAADVAESYIGTPSLLRNEGGPGFLGVILAGAIVALAGLGAVVFARRGWALGIVAAAALPTGFERLAESSAGHNCACLGNDNVSFFQGAGYLSLVAAAVAAVALIVRRPWPGRGWPSAGLAAVGIVSVVAWAIATLVDVYRYYGAPYGTYTAFGGTAFHLAAIVAVLAGMIMARWLAAAAARDVFVGAAALPVCAAVSEIAYAIRYGGDDGFSLGGVAFFAVPALILLVVIAVGWWASRDEHPGLGVAR